MTAKAKANGVSVASDALAAILERAALRPHALSHEEIVRLLATEDEAGMARLFAAARAVRERCGRAAVLPRGLIECSNRCAKDCRYCGIRRSNGRARRYTMPVEEAGACIDEARRRGYPAVALQAGEIESAANTEYYLELLRRAAGLEVTLSLGEQTEEVYRRWREAGALRYLLRIETSNRELYARLHTEECSFERRLECLRTLKRLGYVTGSGVMIGLPGQTTADLAADIEFFGAERLDMVGMGPYIAHPDTPLAAEAEGTPSLALALRMIAVTRLYLHEVNIVAATALSALSPDGQTLGIAAGANVIMPNLTPPKYRGDYDLYPGKIVAG